MFQLRLATLLHRAAHGGMRPASDTPHAPSEAAHRRRSTPLRQPAADPSASGFAEQQPVASSSGTCGSGCHDGAAARGVSSERSGGASLASTARRTRRLLSLAALVALLLASISQPAAAVDARSRRGGTGALIRAAHGDSAKGAAAAAPLGHGEQQQQRSSSLLLADVAAAVRAGAAARALRQVTPQPQAGYLFVQLQFLYTFTDQVRRRLRQ